MFGRTGAVTATSGDYNTGQVTESGNLYFTNARTVSAMAGLFESPLTFSSPLSRTGNTVSCPTCGSGAVASVFGRTGAVTAQSGDYSTSLVSEGTNLYFTNARAQAAMTGLYAPATSGSALLKGNGAGGFSNAVIGDIPTGYPYGNLGSVPSTFTPWAHNLLSASHGDTSAGAAVRGGGIFAVGSTPLWTQVAHSAAAGGYWKWNGTDVVASTGAAAGTGACTIICECRECRRGSDVHQCDPYPCGPQQCDQ